MELDISKSVITDIALAAVERIEGVELALATNRDAARDAATAVSGLNASALSPETLSLPRRPRALKISREGQQVSVSAGVNVEYGRNLLEITNKARLAVAESIELMTGLRVREINVTVQGLYLPGSQA